jgi:hypothetical protein
MTPEQIKHIQELINKTGKRAASFAMMVNHALSIQNPLIVETGCARQENNFDGDGMSTIIFDKLVEYHGGDFYSVDINPDNVKFATSHCKNANMFCGDSVSFLYNQSKSWVANNRKIDVLYLDSYDFDLENPHPSSLHHVMELVAIMPSLKEGTLICVDDNPLCQDDKGNMVEMGKGLYVKQFMEQIKRERIHSGYQWVWKL